MLVSSINILNLKPQKSEENLHAYINLGLNFFKHDKVLYLLGET